MDEQSLARAQVPLLNHVGVKNKTSLFLSTLKWVLKIVMWAVFIAWICFVFYYNPTAGEDLMKILSVATHNTFLGITEAAFFVFSGPVLILAFLSIAYLNINHEEDDQLLLQENKTKHARYKMRTFPIIVDGVFGVVSVAELLGIILAVVFVVWALYFNVGRNIGLMEETSYDSLKELIEVFFSLNGIGLGEISLFLLSFLFLPVARGSVLLRLTNIPFEHAVRYHAWLGHLTMVFLTLHALSYIINWSLKGTLLTDIFSWPATYFCYFPGVIAYSAALPMWVTSIRPVRREKFELFYYTHQLYLIFIFFMAMHIGPLFYGFAAAGIFLFLLDRFLRFWQSRNAVDVISARYFPCGVVELVLSKPSNLVYNALSFIFIRVREVSLLQWHPFSVSTSPLDGDHHLSVLIKVQGEWTLKLKEIILNDSGTEADQDDLLQTQHCPMITAFVEGPYGHESPYYLEYENLILVAGGIGISPFFAILSDILHRVKQQKPCLPRNILLVWAIKKSDELCLLSTISINSLPQDFSDHLKIELLVYVTRESEPPLEEGIVHYPVDSSVCPVSIGRSISILVGTGNKFWPGVYVITSTFGFLILPVLLNVYYINPHNIEQGWYWGLLFFVCMVASVLIFGGAVIALWHLWERKTSEFEKCVKGKSSNDILNSNAANKDSYQDFLASSTTVRYGSRPDFKEIFESISGQSGRVNVGVIVCGPPSLNTSVGGECRAQNLSRKRHHHPIFHFHSHSFEL